MTDMAERIKKLHAVLDRIIKKVPGDGDGDGDANEGRKPKGGGGSRKTHYNSAQAAALLGSTNPATITNVARLQQMKSNLKVKAESYDAAARSTGRSTPLRYKVALNDHATHIDNRIKELTGGKA